MLSNCCGAPFYEPGYPDSDICTACKEHAEPDEEEEEYAKSNRDMYSND